MSFATLTLWAKVAYHVLNNAAGWSSLVARRAHNPKVVGSNPTPATNEDPLPARGSLLVLPSLQ